MVVLLGVLMTLIFVNWRGVVEGLEVIVGEYVTA